jgi:YhcH/YjgK/YiaL family protein
MILDHLDNTVLYRGLQPHLVRALQALHDAELLGRPPGRYELDRSSLYVILQEYSTKPRAQGRWESHRKYIDVQYVIQGVELMGWARTQAQKIVDPYDPDKDVVFHEGEGSFFRADAGLFAIFQPDDSHMPGIAIDIPGAVRKAVFKVAV